MKSLFLLLAVSFEFSVAAQTNEHPVLHEMASTADVIAVAKLREPQVWRLSELIVMTGHATALVERTLKGESLPSKITVQVVRHLDLENLTLESPEVPILDSGWKIPAVQAASDKVIVADDKDQLKSAVSVLVFLRRAKDGTLNAVDGFLYTLPHSIELEGVVSAIAKRNAQKAVDGKSH